MEGQQNKLAKSANFVSKFKAKHVIEEQSQCLEESQNCFGRKVGEGFGFVDMMFFIEQLRSSLRQLQRLRVYNIVLLEISLFTINRQSPLSIKSIYKVHSCEKSNIIPFGYLS